MTALLGQRVTDLSTPAVRYLWSGGLTDTAVVLAAGLEGDSSAVRFAVSTSATLSSPTYSSASATSRQAARAAVSGLTADTTYYYGVEVDGTLLATPVGSFKTLPVAAGTAASFTVACASCASTGSENRVFEAIRTLAPLVFVHMGDFHYQDIAENDEGQFQAGIEAVLAPTVRQKACWANVPIAYVWDDHDFGGNESDGTFVGLPAATTVYRRCVPSYSLVESGENDPIYHSFAVGRVLFLMLDTRTSRSPNADADGASKSMLGTAQKAWLKAQLSAAQGVYPVKVIVSSSVWIAATSVADSWGKFATERQELSEYITAEGITGVCLLAGDAHMLAIDDGTNNHYDDAGTGPGFPVFQAAAMGAATNTKGGPFSAGTPIGGPDHYGRMTVTDTGGATVTVDWSGRTVDQGTGADTEAVALQFVVNV